MDEKNGTRSRQSAHTTKKIAVTERGGRRRGQSNRTVTSSKPSVGADRIALDEPSALACAVREIAIERGVHNFDKKRHIADLVESEFKSRGEFYRTYDDLLYFLPNSERQLVELGRQEFADLLADISGLSQTEIPFGLVLDRLRLLARRALRRKVHTLSYYDQTTGMLAVSDGGTGMWIRERGGHWQRSLNGENGIVFRTDPDADPWEPEFLSNPDSGELTHLNWFMEQFPFGSYNDVSPDCQRTLLRMSMLQRFFPPLARTNLIPTFLGPPGSGKSTAQRLLGRLLVGRRFELSDLNVERHDGFVAAITNRLVHGVDNIDAMVRWFQDDVARYATGTSFTKRRPYSLNDPVSHSPTAWLTLSSCNPYFTRSDIADRLLPLRLGRWEDFWPEDAIFGELERRRNAIMGDVLLELGRIQDCLAKTSHIVGTCRMADFASFMQRAHIDPIVARDQLASLRRLQVDFATDCDDLIEALRLLLERNWPDGIAFTPVAELFRQCVEIAKSAHLSLPTSLQGFGQRLSNEKQNIESRLDVKFMELRGHAHQRKVQLKLSASARKVWPPSPALNGLSG
jgi:hypothetical protein